MRIRTLFYDSGDGRRRDYAVDTALAGPNRHILIIAAVVCFGALVAATLPAYARNPYAGFIIGLRDVCAREPAHVCTGRVAAFLDSNNDKRITLQEFESVRATADTAVRDRGSGLSAIERNMTAIGLLTLQHAKLADVFAAFDTDRSGELSEAELFADFRLDQRPLAKIIADPDGVDWQSFSGRFGKFGFLVRDLLPAAAKN